MASGSSDRGTTVCGFLSRHLILGGRYQAQFIMTLPESPERMTEDGYAVPFGPKQDHTFHAWADGHEMEIIETRLRQGENLITIELRKTEVQDERVPDKIRTDMLERLPTEKPKTGS